MRIQAIQGYVNNNTRSCKKTNPVSNHLSFKSNYEQAMEKVLLKDLRCHKDINSAMGELYGAIIKENGIDIRPGAPTDLGEWLKSRGTELIEELSKPIDKILPNFRDLIISAKSLRYSYVKKDSLNELYIAYMGKQGFLNNFFERESAKNQIKISFGSNIGSLEVFTNKNGQIVTKQFNKNGILIENTYDKFGDRTSLNVKSV